MIFMCSPTFSFSFFFLLREALMQGESRDSRQPRTQICTPLERGVQDITRCLIMFDGLFLFADDLDPGL